MVMTRGTIASRGDDGDEDDGNDDYDDDVTLMMMIVMEIILMINTVSLYIRFHFLIVVCLVDICCTYQNCYQYIWEFPNSTQHIKTVPAQPGHSADIIVTHFGDQFGTCQLT